MFKLCALTASFILSASATAADYKARLKPLNAQFTEGKTSGRANFTVEGGKIHISMGVKGVAPGIMHMQHLHGYAAGIGAKCPSSDKADKNDDSVIDLIETRESAGVTMIPLHDNPASMEIAVHTYPKANAKGAYTYEATISAEELKENFKKKFGSANLDLDKRVIFVHGIPDDKSLPDTVQSLEGVVPQKTLPVACGEIVPTTP